MHISAMGGIFIMMGKIDNPMQQIFLDIDSMIPQNHLLRRIKKDLLTNSLFQEL